jgi:hypothetical protein
MPASGALDWSSHGPAGPAGVGALAPCVHCGRPALLRHPTTGRPCHKTCAERQPALPAGRAGAAATLPDGLATRKGTTT